MTHMGNHILHMTSSSWELVPLHQCTEQVLNLLFPEHIPGLPKLTKMQANYGMLKLALNFSFSVSSEHGRSESKAHILMLLGMKTSAHLSSLN